MKNLKPLLIVIFIIVIISLLFSEFRDYSVTMLNDNLLFIESYRQANPYEVELIFFTSYIILTSLSLPVALVLGLLAGMIFDNIIAIILISFASSLGATIAFLVSRYFFRDFIQNKYARQYHIVNDGVKKNSGYYIFALRMCMVFPFFLVNLLMGLTTVKTIQYYIVSQLGMLPGTIIIVSLGDKLIGTLTSDISIDIDLIVLLTAFGLLPLLSRLLFKKFLD
jgi:uncharacterized membrane protein YdjX (TVP38/TMEM64 family)|tara:strand:+ start:120 stop:788 length:669 start_codon:yes stop_codon:yes gene_type:complete